MINDTINEHVDITIGRGRPVCKEFEDELLIELERSSVSFNDRQKPLTLSDYTYSHIRKVAMDVWNENYWDADSANYIKKWQLNEKTCKLKFSNKWITNFLRRHNEVDINSKISSDATSISFDFDEIMDNNGLFEKLTRTIDTKTITRGRPKSKEFEDEVLIECEKLFVNIYGPRTKALSSNDYSYAHVRKSAMDVWNRDYWDEVSSNNIKKWQFNRRTRNLKFTNKWIHGVLHRHLKQSNHEKVESSAYKVESSAESSSLPQVAFVERMTFESLSDYDYDSFSDIDLNIMIDNDEFDSLLSTSPEPSVPLEQLIPSNYMQTMLVVDR